ncbi:hypothetical protein [Shimia sp. FJ5]|uniref:hypothetical protein n=1 Tax=Shimia sp. FJ5 TaxID=3079054 RepID=UPI0026157BB7|nr:hypothetical protein [Shimia sp. FJ5]MDV4145686.1 hypothetical protein [Shimia sp. FJ5]
MLHSVFGEAQVRANPVPQAFQERLSVAVLLEQDKLAVDLCRKESEFHVVSMLPDTPEDARSVVQRFHRELSYIIIDEDFFGSPEETADAAFQFQRMHPGVQVLGVKSEMWEDECILETLGACHKTLPSNPSADVVLDALRNLH